MQTIILTCDLLCFDRHIKYIKQDWAGAEMIRLFI